MGCGKLLSIDISSSMRGNIAGGFCHIWSDEYGNYLAGMDTWPAVPKGAYINSIGEQSFKISI